MKRISHFTIVFAATLMFAAVPLAIAASPDVVQKVCAAKTKVTYGFQCSGVANAPPTFAQVPVTFVGTVTGDATGVFEGDGIFNANGTSTLLHAKGLADFADRSCFGHIHYVVTSEAGPLPPLDIDFAVVGGGLEILGSTNPLPPMSPLMNCRLVKTLTPD